MASELNLKDTTSPEVVSFHLRDSANLSGGTQDQETYENTNTDTSGRRIKSQESNKGEKWTSERRRSLSDGDSMERHIPCAYNEKEEESLRPTNDTKTLIWEDRSKTLKENHWRFGHDKGNKRYGWDTRRSNDSRDWITISSRGKQSNLSGYTVWGKRYNCNFLGGSSRGENSFEQSIGTRYRRPSQKTVDRRTSSLSDRLRQLASLEMDDTVKERVQQLITFDLDTL